MFAAAIALTLGWVVVVLFAPRWALDAPASVPLPWLREHALLYIAPLGALIAAALATDGEGRRAVLACGASAVAVSSLVDLWRVSRLGLLFDAVLFAVLLAAVHGAGP